MFLLCMISGLSLPVWVFLLAVLALVILRHSITGRWIGQACKKSFRSQVRLIRRWSGPVLAYKLFRRTGWAWPLYLVPVSGGTEPTLSTYGGLLRDLGYAGQLVDQNPYTAESLTNDQSVAIQFGNAVARSGADNTCKAPAVDADQIIGIALRHAIMPTLGPGDGGTNLVQYTQNASVPILRNGFVYAAPVENVNRGDKVISITAQNGALGSSADDPGGADVAIAPAIAATGSIILTAVPTAGDTVTIDGTVVTFEASGATGNQVNLGATAAATATALAAFLNASADANIVKMTYVDSGTGSIEVVSVLTGTAGNAYTLATSDSGKITVSGATLAGGAAAVGSGRVIVPGARWESTTAAGVVGVVYINN